MIAPLQPKPVGTKQGLSKNSYSALNPLKPPNPINQTAPNKTEEEIMMTSEIERLPEACLSHVLSLTSPLDSCVAALVSPTFRRAAESDTIWVRFLPSDHREILSRAVDSVNFSSLKELYLKLCDSILVDGGKKIFSLEKRSGRKCYTLCARDLRIVWADDQRYWRWISHADSRFAEVAELSAVCWLELGGNIDSRLLSPNTTYKTYLIFHLAPESYGLKFPSQQVSVKLGAQISEGQVCLQPNEGRSQRSRREIPADVRVPSARNDGWMEIEMGEFFNEEGGEGTVSFSLQEVNGGNWKCGLIVEGIQVRPC